MKTLAIAGLVLTSLSLNVLAAQSLPAPLAASASPHPGLLLAEDGAERTRKRWQA